MFCLGVTFFVIYMGFRQILVIVKVGWLPGRATRRVVFWHRFKDQPTGGIFPHRVRGDRDLIVGGRGLPFLARTCSEFYCTISGYFCVFFSLRSVFRQAIPMFNRSLDRLIGRYDCFLRLQLVPRVRPLAMVNVNSFLSTVHRFPSLCTSQA